MKTETRERPILFSADMVRAILDGRKTQTRRPYKNRPSYPLGLLMCPDKNRELYEYELSKCPYGQPGDRLWVRETFVLENTMDYHGEHVMPTDGRPVKTETCEEAGEYCLIPHYRATEPEPHIVPYDAVTTPGTEDVTRWTPSIHMPRWASRILLEITDVRVEALGDISDKDAHDEGCVSKSMTRYAGVDADEFVLRFKRRYPKMTRESWVWVVGFKVLEPSS